MSFNLTLSEGYSGPSVELWQTLTWVTLICLSYNPTTNEPDGGHEGVRRRYLHWVESQANSVWKDPEDLANIHDKIREHRETVIAVNDPYFSLI